MLEFMQIELPKANSIPDHCSIITVLTILFKKNLNKTKLSNLPHLNIEFQ